MSIRIRHILSLSGGKDSAALAIYMRGKVSDMEYVFCDTNKELPETYDYLNQIEAYLGKKIIRIEAPRGFDHWLTLFQGYLPSVQARWCTTYLKLKPFEDYIGEQPVINYVGLRADENRDVRISHKPNITVVYPFKEGGVDYAMDEHNAKLVTADMKKKVEAAKADIISGKIKVADYMADNACKY